MKMRSLKILNAIQAKVEVPKAARKGPFYVEGKLVNYTAIMDTRATNNFREEKEAKPLDIKQIKEPRWLKTVNLRPKSIFGVARGVNLGQWSGEIDFGVLRKIKLQMRIKGTKREPTIREHLSRTDKREEEDQLQEELPMLLSMSK